jgi:hypothetical protein
LTSSGNAFRIPDEVEVYFQAEHLVDAGDISVPQTLTIRPQSKLFGKVGLDGKPYAGQKIGRRAIAGLPSRFRENSTRT